MGGAHLRNPELWQRLQSTPITLSDGTDLGVVLADRYDLRPNMVADLLTQYRRFLYLLADDAGPIAPSPAIAQVWQAHRADWDGWTAYSQQMFGRVLPAVQGNRYPDRNPAYRRTLKRLTDEFGITPEAPIWPTPHNFASREALLALLAIGGVAAAIPVGAVFGLGYGIILFVICLAIVVIRGTRHGGYRLPSRSDGSGGDGGGGGGD